MTREEKIDKIVHKCRRTTDCIECKLYGYYAKCPVQLYLKDGTPMTDGSVYLAYKTLFENEETRKEFTKADLEDGMVVELRNGKHLLVIKRGKKIKMLTETQYYSGEDVTEDLKQKNSEKRGELDIVKVFAPAPLEKVANVLNLIEMKGEMLWERREKMTLEEIEQELGYKIEIVEVDEKK